MNKTLKRVLASVASAALAIVGFASCASVASAAPSEVTSNETLLLTATDAPQLKNA